MNTKQYDFDATVLMEIPDIDYWQKTVNLDQLDPEVRKMILQSGPPDKVLHQAHAFIYDPASGTSFSTVPTKLVAFTGVSSYSHQEESVETGAESCNIAEPAKPYTYRGNVSEHLKAFFGGLVLTKITTKWVEEYRDHRRQQPSIRYKGRTVKGATVNRELECLTCVLDLAVRRQYIPENPARGVKHFNELRERPDKQMLTVDQENRILREAPPHLRVGIILLVQTGGRTYSEGFRLRWDQVDWEHRLIRLGNDVKTPGSSEPLPLTDLAYRVLREWREELGSDSPYIFPSPCIPGQPIRSVKTAWAATLKRAGVPHFPIYNLRHAFCTRLSSVAPDAVVQRAMRHTSPETKRRYQLSMVERGAGP